MKYRRISVTAAGPEKAGVLSRIMIIYTGGTFGMVRDSGGTLVPFDFSHILDHLPILRNLSLELTVLAFEEPFDSSNVEPAHWSLLAGLVRDNYADQDGFVILHGTDTMAFTASALSFMLRGLDKPVLLTGAQLPISDPRSDARENLLTALEIASSKIDGAAAVPEVCVYFASLLLRGNRTRKTESLHFDAFESPNYPPLAEAGVVIDYNRAAIRRREDAEAWRGRDGRPGSSQGAPWPADEAPKPSRSAGSEPDLEVWTDCDTDVAVLTLFPGMSPAFMRSVVETPGLKALVLETFGSGNAPSAPWFLDLVDEALGRGIIVLNISQCPGGRVMQDKYETGRKLREKGVISGADLSLEAALTKLMILLGRFPPERVKELVGLPLAGEMGGGESA